MRRQIIWNAGPELDFDSIPKRRRRPNRPKVEGEQPQAIPPQEIPPLACLEPGQSDLPACADYTVQTEVDDSAVEQTLSHPLTQLASYISQLRQHSAVRACDNTGLVFALPFFNAGQMLLAGNKYVIIERCAKVLATGHGWIYCCSCSLRESTLIKAMARVITSATRITEQYCLHIQALLQIVEEFDLTFGLNPEMNDHEHSYATPTSIPGAEDVFQISDIDLCLRSPKGHFGIVRASKTLTCLTCPTICGHVGQAKEILSSEQFEGINSFSLGSTSEARGCLSKRPIRLRPEPGSVHGSPGYNAQAYCKGETVVLHDCSCTQCGCAVEIHPSQTPVKVPLIMRNFVFHCEVFSSNCCGEEYDGNNDSILNMGSYLISHEVMRDYLYNFLQTGHKDRIYFPCARGRLLLSEYTQRQLTPAELEELLLLAPRSLIGVLERFPLQCPDNLKGFVKALSKNSPVCALLHPSPELRQLIEKIACEHPVKNSVEDMRYLQQQVPVLFQVLGGTEEPCIPCYLGPILLELLERSEAPFALVDPAVEELVSPAVGQTSVLSFFPSLPVVRQRGHYVADTKNHHQACHKNATGHPSLLPGVFLIHCEHGICYGFQIMTAHESPDVPFTVLRTRFREMPKVVIYDNCCNLHQYCLNRDPHTFKSTWFLVDRLHWKNHRGCSPGYQLAAYPQHDAINSQVVEQCNATLKKLKSQLSYMTPDNFIRQLKLFLWNKNNTLTLKL